MRRVVLAVVLLFVSIPAVGEVAPTNTFRWAAEVEEVGLWQTYPAAAVRLESGRYLAVYKVEADAIFIPDTPYHVAEYESLADATDAYYKARYRYRWSAWVIQQDVRTFYLVTRR